MQSKAATVDEYLKEVSKERLPAINKIRQLCLQELKGYKEAMRYGGPVYEKNGVPEVGFFSQKNNIALYILKKDVVDKYRDKLKGISVGKGVIRYTNPAKIDFELIKKMLADNYSSSNTICG
jgi:uncharacterized protein YdhG (YjbR/CyaY superfamily)